MKLIYEHSNVNFLDCSVQENAKTVYKSND